MNMPINIYSIYIMIIYQCTCLGKSLVKTSLLIMTDKKDSGDNKFVILNEIVVMLEY